MDIKEFKDCLPKLVFVELGSKTYYTEECSLVDFATGKSKSIASIDALMEEVIDGRKVLDIIQDEDYKMLIQHNGGRGSGSSENGTFKFGHASGNGNGDDNGQTRFPAEFNDGEKAQSFEKALQKFRDKHATSDIEYGIAVDRDGYVQRYVQGNSTSVAIFGRQGAMIIHNHPSGGNFSDSDLLSVSQVAGEAGIVAVGKNGDYIFRKTSNFDGAAFSRAVKNARMSGNSYDDAADKWLKANQKKYGYTYEFRKA